MDKNTLITKIMQKPELKKLPFEDVEMAFSMCVKKGFSDKESVRCTRELLHNVYGAFGSRKLLVLREKDPEWVLRKHVSTRERLPHYKDLYDKLKLKGTIFDLGAGVNGFSLGFIPKIKYVGIEGIGQLVDLMNDYFKKRKLGAKSHHISLFNLAKIKSLIKKDKGKKIVFLFKVLDSLEVLERDYSKKLLEEITPLVDRVVLSFATKSLVSRKRFKVKRNWIIKFIKENFKLLDDFELGGERYIVFKKFKKKP